MEAPGMEQYRFHCRDAAGVFDDLSPMETELVAQARYIREVWNSGVEMDFVDRLQCAIENDPRVRWANDAIVD